MVSPLKIELDASTAAIRAFNKTMSALKAKEANEAGGLVRDYLIRGDAVLVGKKSGFFRKNRHGSLNNSGPLESCGIF